MKPYVLLVGLCRPDRAEDAVAELIVHLPAPTRQNIRRYADGTAGALVEFEARSDASAMDAAQDALSGARLFIGTQDALLYQRGRGLVALLAWVDSEQVAV